MKQQGDARECIDDWRYYEKQMNIHTFTKTTELTIFSHKLAAWEQKLGARPDREHCIH